MNNSNIISDFAKVIREEKKKTAPYDTQAQVVRVEGGTLWVHIPGGVEETPVQKTVDASVGDAVQIRVGGGRAWITGNATAPPTDDRTANAAQKSASTAMRDAYNAQRSAAEANRMAESASQAASSAQESAAEANRMAESASQAASSAQESAAEAGQAARNAQSSANTANSHANSALTQLSIVENVIDVLNWISTHGTYKASTDTAVVPGKYYFTRSGDGTDASPYVYTVVVSPSGNPSANSYYDLDSIDEAVSNYVSTHLALDERGLWIVRDGQSYKILIASNGIRLYDENGKLIAQYASFTQIGADDNTQSYLFADYHSMQLIDKDGNSYLHVSDMRDENGYITERFSGDGVATKFLLLTYQIGHDVTVKIDGTETTNFSIDITEGALIFPTAPSDGVAVEITYEPFEDVTKVYTLGTRRQGSKVGAWSYAVGRNVMADSYASHAEGVGTKATGQLSHAEGHLTEASGARSHAEGWYATASGKNSHAEGEGSAASGIDSHAEGYKTKASGDYGHAEGFETVASGDESHAQNTGTIAAGSDQTAIGRYNKEDTRNKYAFIIGNGYAGSSGTSDAYRSNAIAITWDGDIELALDVNAASSTIDGKLYAAITALGWESDVIV